MKVCAKNMCGSFPSVLPDLPKTRLSENPPEMNKNPFGLSENPPEPNKNPFGLSENSLGLNESVCEDVCGSAVSLGSCLITPTLLVHSHFHNVATWDEDEDDNYDGDIQP